MDTFLDNAQKIFDVARAGPAGESHDFALVFRPDGGLHMIMESPASIEAALDEGARTAYRVTRSQSGIRVAGRSMGQSCVLEAAHPRRSGAELLRDQPLYLITSPLIAAPS